MAQRGGWEKTGQIVHLVAALLTLIFVFTITYQVSLVLVGVDKFATRIPRAITVQEITTTWTSSNGEHSITTKRNVDESVANWLARHQEAVDAAQVIWPPV